MFDNVKNVITTLLSPAAVFIAGSFMYKRNPPQGNILLKVCKCIGVGHLQGHLPPWGSACRLAPVHSGLGRSKVKSHHETRCAHAAQWLCYMEEVVNFLLVWCAKYTTSTWCYKAPQTGKQTSVFAEVAATPTFLISLCTSCKRGINKLFLL